MLRFVLHWPCLLIFQAAGVGICELSLKAFYFLQERELICKNSIVNTRKETNKQTKQKITPFPEAREEGEMSVVDKLVSSVWRPGLTPL